MKLDWSRFKGKMLNLTMHENYGLTIDPKSNSPIYEIVFKTGRLVDAFDDGLLLEAEREKQKITIFVPYSSIKCAEIFNI